MKYWYVPMLSALFLQNGCAAKPMPELPSHDIMIIAHRGAAGLAPENTLPAIRLALEQRADAIEVDLRQTADGALVAMHDATVDRTTDGTGRVDSFTLAELRRLDAGSWFASRFAGTRVPTLAEILDAVPEQTRLILELKDGSAVYPGIEESIVSLLEARGRRNVILKSFNTGVLAAFRRLAPERPRLYVFNAHIPWLHLIVDDGLRIGTAWDQDVQWLQKHSFFITGGFVRRAQERGYRVVAWHVHDRETMQDMIRLGVDAIETDYPGVLRELLQHTEQDG